MKPIPESLTYTRARAHTHTHTCFPLIPTVQLSLDLFLQPAPLSVLAKQVMMLLFTSRLSPLALGVMYPLLLEETYRKC